MANKRITDLPSGSINDSALGFSGNPMDGELFYVSYKQVKDYILDSFNAFSSSYVGDSGSFNTEIGNVFASQSNYLLTGAFSAFSSSYSLDSGSFLSLIHSITGSALTGSYVTTGSFNSFSSSYFSDSSSFNSRINNTLASESNYLPTSSIAGIPNSLSIFSGSNALSSSIVYQSSGSIIIGDVTSSGNSILQVSGSVTANALYLNGQTTGSEGNYFAVSTYGRIATVPTKSFAAGFEEYSFINAHTGFYGYAGVQSSAYVIGGLGTTVHQGKFDNYIAGFTSLQVWDGSGNSGSNNQLSNAIGYLSAISSQTGSILNAYDIYISELNSVQATTLPPVVTNHYGLYMEPCTSASNNYGVFISGSQTNYFGGKVLIGGKTSANASLLQIFGSVFISQSLYDNNGNTGTPGQVLTSTGTGIQWINASGSTGLTGSFVTTASFNSFSSSYVVDSASFNARINAISGSTGLTGSFVTTGSFNTYSASVGIQIANVYASESRYLPTASYLVDSASFDSRINNVTGSGNSSFSLNFIVGDGGTYTPVSGSTQFSGSGNPLINKTIITLFQESYILAPISRSVAWFSFTSSAGIININNATFDVGTFYQVVYR